jgi:catechol 2,3-dioxygenase-like lactoylglutathione lyase family enzyme
MRNLSVVILSLALLGGCTQSELSGRPDDAVVRGVNFVGKSVSNLEQSITLYQNSVDLQLVQEAEIRQSAVIDALSGHEGTLASTRLMKSVNAQLQFMQFDNPPAQALSTKPVGVNGPGIAHVCYQVAQATKAYDRFLEGGATPIGDREMVQLNKRNPVYYAYAHDHDNAVVEIEHVDIDALNLPTPPKNQYRIRHVSLATPDIDRAVDFYSVLLQEEVPRRAGELLKLSGGKLDKISGLPDSRIEMAWFQVRNLELEIIQYHSHPVETPVSPRPLEALGYNMIVFDVADLNAARERLLTAGGKLVLETQPMDGGEILFGRDPDGNLLGFQKIADNAPFSSQNFHDNGT